MSKSIKEKIDTINEEASNRILKVIKKTVRKQELRLVTDLTTFIDTTLSDKFYEDHLTDVTVKSIYFAYDVLEDTIEDIAIEDLSINVVVDFEVGCKKITMFGWIALEEEMSIRNMDIQLSTEHDDADIGGLSNCFVPTILEKIKNIEA